MELDEPKPELTIYSERNSVGVEENANALFEPSPVELTPEQQNEISAFAEGLFKGKIGELNRGCEQNLQEIQGMSPSAFVQEFFLGYFYTPEGRQDLVLAGVGKEARAVLMNTRNVKSNIDAKTRKLIAKRSLDWYKAHIAASIEGPAELDLANLDDDRLLVNYEPQRLIKKLELLAAHRKFYREVSASLPKLEDPLTQAKRIELNQTRARTNEMMADLYNSALELGKQLLDSDPEEAKPLLDKLEELKPLVYRAVTRDRQENIAAPGEEPQTRQSLRDFGHDLSRRMDYVGMGVDIHDGQITSISDELIDFAKQVEQTSLVEPQAEFDEETLKKMKETRWDGQQLKDLCEEILRNWGLLSIHEVDWSEASEREGKATDDLWQVILDPQADSLSVSKSKKILKVPQSFNRSIIKALPVAAHELTHLLQAEYDFSLSEQIPLAAVGGKRNTTLREAGALDQETNAFASLGETRPTRVAYLRALQIKLAGGNLVQVARSFYQSYEDESKASDKQKEENRALAADRALRLYRKGGYNTQPLDYIEGQLSAQALRQISPDVAASVLIAGTAFSLQDSLALHQAGIYNLPTSVNRRPSEDVLNLFREKYLQAL